MTAESFWEMITSVPMPWRMGLIIGALLSALFFALRLLLPFLLWPEFHITTRLRQRNRAPLPGTYTFGNIIKGALRINKALLWIGIIGLGGVMGLFFLQTELDEPNQREAANLPFAWWEQVEVRFGRPETAPEEQDVLSEPDTEAPEGEEPNLQPGSSSTDEEDTDLEDTTGTAEDDPPAGGDAPNDGAPPTPTPAVTRGVTENGQPYLIHVVSAGDTLFDLAQNYGTSMDTIVELNAEQYPALEEDRQALTVGWRLRIPEERPTD